MTQKQFELKAAEFGRAQRNRYRPRLPWRRLGLFLGLVALLVGAYLWRQAVRADALRGRMQEIYASEVVPVTSRLDEMLASVQADALSAKEGAAERLVAGAPRLSELHDQQLLYLRVRATDLASVNSLREAIAAPTPDAIGACLGANLVPVDELGERPEVLSADWLAGAEDTNDMMRLRVREEALSTGIRRELPRLKELASAEYFLLLLVQGQSRLSDPVDLFLWRLEDDELLLRSRTENRGKLISVRNQYAGSAPKADAAELADPVAAADCSIAAHLKAQLGEPTMTLGAAD